MEPRPEQDLVGVDVPDARHDRLVEEKALEAALPAPKARGERFPARFQGLGPEGVELRGRSKPARSQDSREAELPDVVESKLG